MIYFLAKVGSCIVVGDGLGRTDHGRRNPMFDHVSESSGLRITGVYTPNVGTTCFFLLSNLGQNKIQEK